jgi:Domain of Unknown Function (DUF1206)
MNAEATTAAREAGDSPLVEWGARLGYAVLGVIHLLIAWIALRVAWGVGGGSETADTSGALQTLSASGTGTALLWVCVLGFLLLAVWQLLEAAVGLREMSDRAKATAKGVTYLFFAWTTLKVAQGTSSSAEKQTEDFTAGLMESPGGRVLVGLLGLVVLGIAGYHVYKGWTKKFLQDLRENPGEWAVTAGRLGYIAKGVALLIVGFFFLIAAWTADPDKAQGLDGALKTVKDQALGPILLTLVALGIAAYGVYSFARSRYARV